MTIEEKKLLVRDLIGRIPYGVMVRHNNSGVVGVLHDISVYPKYDGNDICDYLCSIMFFGDESISVEYFKPILRPVSDMTKEEYEDFYKAVATDNNNHHGCVVDGKPKIFTIGIRTMAWLNAHHFDYRGLIERKLALDVKETSNPYKEKEQ